MKAKNIFFAVLLLCCATPQYLWVMHEPEASPALVHPKTTITTEEWIKEYSEAAYKHNRFLLNQERAKVKEARLLASKKNPIAKNNTTAATNPTDLDTKIAPTDAELEKESLTLTEINAIDAIRSKDFVQLGTKYNQNDFNYERNINGLKELFKAELTKTELSEPDINHLMGTLDTTIKQLERESSPKNMDDASKNLFYEKIRKKIAELLEDYKNISEKNKLNQRLTLAIEYFNESRMSKKDIATLTKIKTKINSFTYPTDEQITILKKIINKFTTDLPTAYNLPNSKWSRAQKKQAQEALDYANHLLFTDLEAKETLSKPLTIVTLSTKPGFTIQTKPLDPVIKSAAEEEFSAIYTAIEQIAETSSNLNAAEQASFKGIVANVTEELNSLNTQGQRGRTFFGLGRKKWSKVQQRQAQEAATAAIKELSDLKSSINTRQDAERKIANEARLAEKVKLEEEKRQAGLEAAKLEAKKLQARLEAARLEEEERQAALKAERRLLLQSIRALETEVANALEAKGFVNGSDIPQPNAARALYQQFEDGATLLSNYVSQGGKHNLFSFSSSVAIERRLEAIEQTNFNELKELQKELLKSIPLAKHTEQSTANYQALRDFNLSKTQEEAQKLYTEYAEWYETLPQEKKTLFQTEKQSINYYYDAIRKANLDNTKTKGEKLSIITSLNSVKSKITDQYKRGERPENQIVKGSKTTPQLASPTLTAKPPLPKEAVTLDVLITAINGNIALLRTEITAKLEEQGFASSADIPPANRAFALYQEFERNASTLSSKMGRAHVGRPGEWRYKTPEEHKNDFRNQYDSLKKLEEYLIQQLQEAEHTDQSKESYQAVQTFDLTKVKKDAEKIYADYLTWYNSLSSEQQSAIRNKDSVRNPVNYPYQKIMALDVEKIKSKEDKVKVLSDLKYMKLLINEEHALAEQVSP